MERHHCLTPVVTYNIVISSRLEFMALKINFIEIKFCLPGISRNICFEAEALHDHHHQLDNQMREQERKDK